MNYMLSFFYKRFLKVDEYSCRNSARREDIDVPDFGTRVNERGNKNERNNNRSMELKRGDRENGHDH